ncbi:MAG TPA: hypothetical protein VF613_04875 [Longimicrobium sp.]|jgi:hypothetical protein
MQNKKTFDAVRLMRELRARVTRELDGLTFEEQHRWIQEQIAQPKTPSIQPMAPNEKREQP